jgi:hypothetical protein
MRMSAPRGAALRHVYDRRGIPWRLPRVSPPGQGLPQFLAKRDFL